MNILRGKGRERGGVSWSWLNGIHIHDQQNYSFIVFSIQYLFNLALFILTQYGILYDMQSLLPLPKLRVSPVCIVQLVLASLVSLVIQLNWNLQSHPPPPHLQPGSKE